MLGMCRLLIYGGDGFDNMVKKLSAVFHLLMPSIFHQGSCLAIWQRWILTSALLSLLPGDILEASLRFCFVEQFDFDHFPSYYGSTGVTLTSI